MRLAYDDDRPERGAAGGTTPTSGSRPSPPSWPTIVCLHAIGHGAGDHASLRARYRGRYRVITLDWPGHGRSAADLGELVPRVTCPVLVTWGIRDPVNELRFNRPAIARFPRATLVTFPAGPAPFLETPEAFDAPLDRFLEAGG